MYGNLFETFCVTFIFEHTVMCIHIIKQLFLIQMFSQTSDIQVIKYLFLNA